MILKVEIKMFNLNLKLKHQLLNVKNEIVSRLSLGFFIKYYLIKKLQLIKKSKTKIVVTSLLKGSIQKALKCP